MVAVITLVALPGAAGRMSAKPVIVLASIALVAIGADFLVFGSGLLFGSDHLRGLALLVPCGIFLALVASLLSLRAARKASA